MRDLSSNEDGAEATPLWDLLVELEHLVVHIEHEVSDEDGMASSCYETAEMRADADDIIEKALTLIGTAQALRNRSRFALST